MDGFSGWRFLDGEGSPGGVGEDISSPSRVRLGEATKRERGGLSESTQTYEASREKKGKAESERQRLLEARRQRGKNKKKTRMSDARKPQESVPVKSAMDQEVIGPNSADDERILQQMLQSKLDLLGDSFIQDEAEEKERRAMLKEVQEELARRKKAMLLYWQGKLPAKDRKAQAPVVIQAEESAMDHEVIADDKQKLGIWGSNRMTKATSNFNSVTIQDDHVDKAKSALAKKTADEEATAYASYRSCWEHNCCKGDDCDHYNHKTALSSMLFTHCTPGKIPFYVAVTLQIFSMKLKLTYDNPGGFEFPLSVYGVVAVRDALDSRRNILFSCDRTEAQELTQDEPFLHLTGPSRAILCTDKVYFEIYLRVKGAEDKPLITCARAYGGRGAALCFSNVLCTLEVCLQTVKEALQATIVAVQIVRKEELWPFNFAHGGMVACTPLPRTRAADSGGVSPSDQTIVLIESKDREMPQGDYGYLHLSRQVVCVERGGGLDVVMQAYTKSGTLRAEGRLHFKAQKCHMSQQQCIVGRARVIVDVAWSIVPTNMDAFGL
ncbi:unnamed protein product [Alopecurus aequalis]